jgi:hypothetical protein
MYLGVKVNCIKNSQQLGSRKGEWGLKEASLGIHGGRDRDQCLYSG